MSAESVVFGWLSGYAPLTSLVSTRIYPDVIPEQVNLPAVAFTRSGTEMIGTIHDAKVDELVTMQIQAWSATKTEADAVGDQVASALKANGEPMVARGSVFDESTGYYGSAIDIRLLVNSP